MVNVSRVKRFLLPDLGEGLTEGEILRWFVAVGETVELNQPIVEIETAKAAVEIPAMWAGRVEEIFHAEGETIDVGTPIIAIDVEPGSPEEQAPPAGAGRTPVLVGYGPRSAAGGRRRHRRAEAGVTAAVPADLPTQPRPLAKPPVRKLARDLGVDLRQVARSAGTAPVSREDVLVAAATNHRPTAVREQRVPVRGVRRTTAENMVASAFTAPHVTEFLTVDMTRSIRALDRLRKHPAMDGVRLSPLTMVAKAALAALRRHPMINSSWGGDEIIVREYVNLGIATATERGLLVPNIKDADRLTTAELAMALATLVATARTGATTPAELAGGTFTITNIGVFGVDTGTPILPPGQAAILALGAVRDGPWVHKGKVRVRKITTLGLSFDHRIVDGDLGSAFLRDIGFFLHDPGTFLLAWG